MRLQDERKVKMSTGGSNPRWLPACSSLLSTEVSLNRRAGVLSLGNAVSSSKPWFLSACFSMHTQRVSGMSKKNKKSFIVTARQRRAHPEVLI